MSHQIRFTYSLSGVARKSPPKCLAILNKDNWDDFSFKTMFSLSVYDENGKHVTCGSVKIGFIGQTDGRTSDQLPLPLEQLPDNFFSLGQDVEYYKNIRNELSEEVLPLRPLNGVAPWMTVLLLRMRMG